MNLDKQVLFLLIFLIVTLSVHSVVADNAISSVSPIYYKEKIISEVSEIPVYDSKNIGQDKNFTHKVDELIDLLEAHKRAEESGSDIDLLRKKVNEIDQLLEGQKSGPLKLSSKEFHNTLCFTCHGINDFSPVDKTQKQWQRLIEEDGHAIFAKISWETPLQKHQIVEFLVENAGNYRAKGIGLWD